MSVYDELREIQQKAGEQQDKLSDTRDRLNSAVQILKRLNKGDEIGEVMDEIEEVIEIIEAVNSELY